MGFKDILNKAKDTALAAKEKAVQVANEAVQAAKDYKQMYDEASAEAANWRKFNPDLLNAVLKGDNAKAASIYMQDTGATQQKADMVIKKITDEVKQLYPGILRKQRMKEEMNSIKGIWPFGEKEITVLGFKSENLIFLGSLKLWATGNGSYKASFDIKDFSDRFSVIFKDKIYFKSENDSSIYEVKDFSFTYNDYYCTFNPKDELYISKLGKYNEVIGSLKKPTAFYPERTIEQVRSGSLSLDAMVALSDKYSIKINNGYISAEGFNVGKLVKDMFFHLCNSYGEKKGNIRFELREDVYNYIKSYGIEQYAWGIGAKKKALHMLTELRNIPEFDSWFELDEDGDKVINVDAFNNSIGPAIMVFNCLNQFESTGKVPVYSDRFILNPNSVFSSFMIKDQLDENCFECYTPSESLSRDYKKAAHRAVLSFFNFIRISVCGTTNNIRIVGFEIVDPEAEFPERRFYSIDVDSIGSISRVDEAVESYVQNENSSKLA